jgi:hypothetical protein
MSTCATTTELSISPIIFAVSDHDCLQCHTVSQALLSTEFAGFEFDIKNMFPPKEPTRTLFLRQYVQAAASYGIASAADANDDDFIDGLDVSVENRKCI